VVGKKHYRYDCRLLPCVTLMRNWTLARLGGRNFKKNGRKILAPGMNFKKNGKRIPYSSDRPITRAITTHDVLLVGLLAQPLSRSAQMAHHYYWNWSLCSRFSSDVGPLSVAIAGFRQSTVISSPGARG
jgi:hypothetical protein